MTTSPFLVPGMISFYVKIDNTYHRVTKRPLYGLPVPD
jgi:hypothetical protein